MKTESIQAITPVIQAITPLFLGFVGFGIFGLTIAFSNQINDVRWASGLGLAGTAITGAAGLARNTVTVPA